MRETTPDLTRISKYISLILRHKPEVIGIKLDTHGWADVNALLAGISRKYPINRDILEEIVRSDEKQRYSFSEDGTKIRANQGHSIQVDVELPVTEPPETLYHGTAQRFAASIEIQGLLPQSRLYVHLSPRSRNRRKSRPAARQACGLPGGCRTDAPRRISLLFIRQWSVADKGGPCSVPETLRGVNAMRTAYGTDKVNNTLRLL